MRRFLLALGLVLACGREPSGTVITISGSVLGREGELLRRQVHEFEKQNPGIRVRVQQTPDDATQRHQLYVQWLNAHLGRPDVLQLDVIWTAEFAAAGWILPLDRFQPDVRDFFPATMQASAWNGSLYAVPWYVDAGMLYWRTDLLPRPPQSLVELTAFAREHQSPRMAGLVWQGARYEGLVTVFLEYLGGFGGEILSSDGRVAVDSPAAVQALEFMRRQIELGIVPPVVLTWHEEETRFAFQNGRAVFLRNWPYAYALMNDPKESRVAGRFNVSPMPAAPEGHRTATLGGGQLAINAFSRHPEEAYRLIGFLTAPQPMIERARVTGQLPPRRSLYQDARLADALNVPMDSAMKVLDAAIPRPVTPIYSELSEILQIYLHRALAGQIDSRSALNAAAAEMRRVMKSSGLERIPA